MGESLPKKPTLDAEQLARQWTSAQPAVAAYISGLVVNYHDAQDILQNVATVLIRKRADYEVGTSFLKWALAVAHFEVLAYRRKRAMDRHVLDDESLAMITAAYQSSSRDFGVVGEALDKCMQKLTPASRRMLNLRYADGLLPSEMTSRLDRSVNAITVALHRVRSALRRCVETHMARIEETS